MTLDEAREMGRQAALLTPPLPWQKCKQSKAPTPHVDPRHKRIPLTISTGVCANLGPPVSQQKPCGCREKLRVCDVHGECTTGKPRTGVACCLNCPDYESIADGSDSRRHLIYYLYPVASNGMWKWNLEQLLTRISLFNGRRVIAVAIPDPNRRRLRHPLVPVAEIQSLTAPYNFDIITVPQKKRLGEVTGFAQLLNRIRLYTRPTDYFFYAHGKGVVSSQRTTGTKTWADLMYRVNLDNWDVVENHLKLYPVVGALRCKGLLFPWHYSGTFYWCRSRDVFNRNYSDVPQRYGGVEMWPSRIFDYSESACLYGDEQGMLYDPVKSEQVLQTYINRGLDSLVGLPSRR